MITESRRPVSVKFELVLGVGVLIKEYCFWVASLIQNIQNINFLTCRKLILIHYTFCFL